MIKLHHSFIDIADGLVGVGLITQRKNRPGMLQLDKGHNDMSKFLNRILGMKVEKQNLLFRYFADTLNAIINQAKRSGKYDQVYLLSITLFFVIINVFLLKLRCHLTIHCILGYSGCWFNT